MDNNKARSQLERNMPSSFASSRRGFDEWASLARQDPEIFEIQRFQVIEQAIGDAPERIRPRLRCLQWKLDRVRELAPTPLAATLHLHQLLWEQVTGPDGLLDRLSGRSHPVSASEIGKTGAKILEFRQK